MNLTSARHISPEKFEALKQSWRDVIRPYQTPSFIRSSWQLVNSLIPYLALWFVSYKLLAVSIWASLACSVVAVGFLIRVFIIAHDCGHGSFFKSRRANEFWGSITSLLAFLPYHHWRHEHAVHHAHSGDLDNRGVGDIRTLTVREYKELGRWARFRYRAYRHPVGMFLIGPLFIFLISYRFWPKGANRRVKMSVVRNNITLAVVATVACLTIGWKAYLLVQIPIIAMAGSAGIFLFYVQHQFDGVYWKRAGEWDFFDQAIEGSSYFKLPRVLQWFTGNIGFHHVHHLGARIPNYFLERCHNEIAFFRRIQPVTLWAGLKCVNFHLYDEDRGMLVGFAAVR